MYSVKLRSSRERNRYSIGRGLAREADIILHSDTIFSAICNNMRKASGAGVLDKFLQAMRGKKPAPFKISSGFHYFEITSPGRQPATVFFVPKPRIKFPFTAAGQVEVTEHPKTFKRIRFISLAIALKLQRGEKLGFSKNHVIGGNYLVDDEDLAKMGLDAVVAPRPSGFDPKVIFDKIRPYTILEQHRVVKDRVVNSSDPFTTFVLAFPQVDYYVPSNGSRQSFTLQAGLYFLIEDGGLPPENLGQVVQAIRLVKDGGIGGKRSLGCGLCDGVEIAALDDKQGLFQLVRRGEGRFHVNISLVHPTNEDIPAIVDFNLLPRDGFIHSNGNTSRRFKDVKFIEEGSVFSTRVAGGLPQVAPADFSSTRHEVYKYGIGMYYAVKGSEDE